MVNNPFMIQAPKTPQQSPLDMLSGFQQMSNLGKQSQANSQAQTEQPALSGIGLQQQVESMPQEVTQMGQQQLSLLDNPMGSIAAAAIARSINSRLGG